MQKSIFIDYNNNDYCIELNKDNLNRLVEDYKEEVDKFKLFLLKNSRIQIYLFFFSDTNKNTRLTTMMQLFWLIK